MTVVTSLIKYLVRLIYYIHCSSHIAVMGSFVTAHIIRFGLQIIRLVMYVFEFVPVE